MDAARELREAFGTAAEQTRRRSPASFDQWFSGVQLDGVDGRVLLLAARDEFVRDWVKNHFLPDLLDTLAGILGPQAEGLEVRWRIAADIPSPVSEPRRPSQPPEAPRRPSRPPESVGPRLRATVPPRPSLAEALNPKHTFANFVVGPSNELAYAAALASAAGGRPRYNPLFIAGGTGLGKTHLMHAIAHRVLEERPDTRIVYLSAEHFTNAFIEALQHHKMDEFRARYRANATSCSWTTSNSSPGASRRRKSSSTRSTPSTTPTG
jgi:chromosomal replication initiator protein